MAPANCQSGFHRRKVLFLSISLSLQGIGPNGRFARIGYASVAATPLNNMKEFKRHLGTAGLIGLVLICVLTALRAQEDAPEDAPLEDTNSPALLIDTNAEPKVVQPAH